MNTREFLEAVWGDAEGFYCIAIPFMLQGWVKPLYKHHVFETINEAVKFVKTVKDDKDVFFAVHTLEQERVWNPEKINQKTQAAGAFEVRTHANMKQSRAFFFDLDVGVSTETSIKYATREEALNDLERFLFLTGLPDPMVTSSGGGFHVYWLVEQPIPSAKWRIVAAKLHAVATHLGMKHDPARTTDQSSVLRVVGTFNQKKTTKRPVVALHEAEVTPNADFRTRLNELVSRFNLLDPTAHHSKPSYSTAPSAAGNIPDNTTIAYSGQVTTLRNARNACGQVRAFVASGGRVPEPVWYNMLGLIAPMRHGGKLIHKLSRGPRANPAPGYNYAATEAKLAQYQARTGGQPPSCATLRLKCGAKECLACPNQALGSNPLIIANKYALQAPVVPQAADPIPLIPPPEPYSFAKGGVMWTHKVLKDEKMVAVVEPISTYLMFPYEDFDKVGAEASFSNWWVKLPLQGWISVRVERRWYNDMKAMLGELANEGVQFANRFKPEVMNFMTAYIKKLQEHQRAHEQFSHLGWTAKRTKFVLGSKVLCTDGTEHVALLSAQAKSAHKWVATDGTMAAHIEALKFYARDEYIASQVAILCSLGSPLMRSTDYGGVTVSLSGASGGTKSTTLYGAGSIWGPPKMYVLDATSNGSTVGARAERVTTLANLPTIMDEMTHISPEAIKNFVMGVTQHQEKARLDSKGVEKATRSEDKSSLVLVSTNTSIHQLLAIDNQAGTAGTARVFEIMMPQVDKAHKAEADRFRHAINDNHGWIGEEFMRQIITQVDDVVEAIRVAEIKLFNDWNCETIERYYAAVGAVVMITGRIANKLGLLHFDMKKIQAWLRDVQLPYLRSVLKTEALAISPITVLTNYIEHINDSIIRVRPDAKDSNIGYAQNQNTIRDMRGHWDVATNILYLRKDAFREWCEKRGRPGLGIITGLVAAGIVSRNDLKFTLGRGTDHGKMRSICFAVELLHPALSGVIAPPAAPAPAPNVVPFQKKGAASTTAPTSPGTASTV